MASQIVGKWISLCGARTRSGRRVRLELEGLEVRAVPSGTDLGAATNFNAFIFNDYTARYTDADGAVAVGHDAHFTGYGVGSHLSNSLGKRDDLVVGHDLTYHQGQVFNGNAVYGHTGDIRHVGFPHGSARHAGSPVDFAAAQSDLTKKSTDWGAIAPNGTKEIHHGTITLKGTDRKINIFSISQAELANSHGLDINAPARSTVLINVTGDAPRMQNFGMWVHGTDRNHVLFNFPTAQTLSIQGIAVEGSVLAPKASVTFNNGRIEGDLIANNLTGNGQFNLAQPRLDINPPPPATASLDGSVFQGEGHSTIGVRNITITLTAKDEHGHTIGTRSTTSQADGKFHFASLAAGTYDLKIVLAGTGLGVVSERAGTAPANLGAPDGTISDIVIDVGQVVTGFGFQVARAIS